MNAVAQPLPGADEFRLQMRQIATTDIAQFHPLEIIPDALVGIEIRRIARQLLEMEPFGCARLEKRLDGLGAMNRRAIPDQQDLARQLA